MNRLVTELLAPVEKPAYRVAYADALRAIRDASEVSVVDRIALSGDDQDDSPTLVIRALPTSHPYEATVALVQVDCDRQDADRYLMLGISLVGEGGEESVEQVASVLPYPEPPLLRLIEASATEQELRSSVVRWTLMLIEMLRTDQTPVAATDPTSSAVRETRQSARYLDFKGRI